MCGNRAVTINKLLLNVILGVHLKEVRIWPEELHSILNQHQVDLIILHLKW